MSSSSINEYCTMREEMLALCRRIQAARKQYPEFRTMCKACSECDYAKYYKEFADIPNFDEDGELTDKLLERVIRLLRWVVVDVIEEQKNYSVAFYCKPAQANALFAYFSESDDKASCYVYDYRNGRIRYTTTDTNDMHPHMHYPPEYGTSELHHDYIEKNLMYVKVQNYDYRRSPDGFASVQSILEKLA